MSQYVEMHHVSNS